jgi:hypothetical protein
MRVMGIVLLAIALAGCTGDRIKQGMNSPNACNVQIACVKAMGT